MTNLNVDAQRDETLVITPVAPCRAAKMETQDPVVTAASRARELWELSARLDDEEFELAKKVEAPNHDTLANRPRLHLIKESNSHIWDEVETLRAEMSLTDATSLPGVFAQVLRAWYLAREGISGCGCTVERREMDRLFMSVVRYLAAETGLAPEEFGAKGFFTQATREIINQGYKVA